MRFILFIFLLINVKSNQKYKLHPPRDVLLLFIYKIRPKTKLVLIL